MANVITSIAQQTSPEFELFLKPLIEDPRIDQLPFDLVMTKFQGKDLFFNNNLDKITTKKVSCGWTSGGSVDFIKKTVNPVELQATVEQCYNVLVNTIFANGMADGWRRGELTPEILDFLSTQRAHAFNRDLLSILFLGDTLSLNPYYTPLDGIWKKLQEGANAADGTVNAGTFAVADFSPANFFATLKSIHDQQPLLLKQVERQDKVWLWTDAVYDAYLEYLYVSTQTNAGIVQRESIVDGITANSFLGIPIVRTKIVDERLAQDFPLLSPFRTILTVPSNHKVVLDASGFLEELAWYERKEDTYYLAGSALLAYAYGYGEFNVFSL